MSLQSNNFKYPKLDKRMEDLVEILFRRRWGQGRIAQILECKTAQVARVMKERNLTRTKQEATASISEKPTTASVTKRLIEIEREYIKKYKL